MSSSPAFELPLDRLNRLNAEYEKLKTISIPNQTRLKQKLEKIKEQIQLFLTFTNNLIHKFNKEYNDTPHKSGTFSLKPLKPSKGGKSRRRHKKRSTYKKK